MKNWSYQVPVLSWALCRGIAFYSVRDPESIILHISKEWSLAEVTHRGGRRRPSHVART